ncbi:MAG: alpha/beta hydrolase [Bacillus sp. (in: Bacteria)]|nr:alpha/beta hydrolase [Bacillus sp. (in: firmicutes)]
MLDYHFFQNIGKDCIVLLHGIGGNSNIFYKQLGEYKKEFSVLCINLPGHGDSPNISEYDSEFSFDLVTREIFKTMDGLNIKNAHFVGISLGSVVLHNILQYNPVRVKSAVLGGAVTRFNRIGKIFLTAGNMIKDVTPHMVIYKLFANIMMPKKNHARSRKFFIQEAKKMKHANFISWYKIIRNLDTTYSMVQEIGKDVKKLYISGREDHLFLDSLKNDIAGDDNARLIVLEDCGHVCNIEKGDEFNEASLEFLRNNVEEKDKQPRAI